MNHRQHTCRTGMTLFELMLALALSTLLLAGLVGVLSGVSKQAKVSESFEQPAWPSRTADILRNDLLAAESLWRQGETVWMLTDAPPYQGIENPSRRVGYACQAISDDQHALVRIAGTHTALLGLGPTEFVLERIDGNGIAQPLPHQPGPVPASARLLVRGPEDMFLNQDLLIR